MPTATVPTAETQVLSAVEDHGWELLIGPTCTGRSIASVAGRGLDHPLRVVADSIHQAVDELAEAISEHLAEESPEIPPGPVTSYVVRYQGGDGRMVSVQCTRLDEAQELAGRHGGHILRRTVEAVG